MIKLENKTPSSGNENKNDELISIQDSDNENIMSYKNYINLFPERITR
jgi:hypothetical protein